MATQTIGAEALIHNSRLDSLNPLIGTWTVTGSHPMVPGKTFHGRTSFERHAGGAFILMHSEMDEPEIPSAVAILGSDQDPDRITMLYFDERGVSRKFDVSVDGDTVLWRRENAKFSQEMKLTVAAAGDRIDQTGRMSQDGGPWEADLALTYVRAAD